MTAIVKKYPFLKGFKQLSEVDYDGLNCDYQQELTLAFVITEDNQLTHLLIDGGDDESDERLNTWFKPFAQSSGEYLEKLIAMLIDLGETQTLKYLSIVKAQLTALPQSFGQLQSLAELYVNHNQLTTLPQSLGQLQSLTRLIVENNQLTALPLSIGQLQSLTSLYVDNNQLIDLPQSLGQLQNLTVLDVSYNQLTALPQSLGRLQSLNSFGVAGSPITADIHELADELDSQSRIRYLLEIQKTDTVQLNEAKVLVLGDERVGKTSLINRIFDRPMDTNQASTMGINIEPFMLNCGIKVNIWDFAGQEVTHQTHQFFLSARSLYLLVVDGQKEDDSSKTRYWLNTIAATAGKEAPIVVLCNKMDLNPGFVFDLHRFKDEFNIVDVLYVTANNQKPETTSQHDISDIKTIVTKHVQRLKDVSLKFPSSWLAVKNALEQQQKQGVDFVEANQFEQICEQSGVTEHVLQNALLDVLNQIGTVVSYQQHDTLNIMQIINPLWVTEGVYKILRAEQLGQNQAILSRQQYDNIFAGNAKYARARHYQWLEELLKQFELAFRIDDRVDGRVDGRVDDAKSKQLLIPARLNPNQPDFNVKHYQQGLNFRFEYSDILKPHLISRFIVQMHRYISDIESSNGQVPYWKRGVFLTQGSASGVVISDEDKKTITIAVDSNQRDGKELLTVIRHCIRRINGEHLKVIEQVPVVEDGKVLDFVDYKLLRHAEGHNQRAVQVNVQGDYAFLDVAELIDGYRINDDTRFDYDKFLKDLFDISARQTENRADIVKESEDATNRRFRTALLDCNYSVADQSQGGQSASGNNAGERDLVIRNKDTGIAEVIIEAQNIKSFNKASITEHFERIAKYDTVGNSISVLLNYVKAPDFAEKVAKYQTLFDGFTVVESDYSHIVIGESRLGKRRVRHLMINFCG